MASRRPIIPTGAHRFFSANSDDLRMVVKILRDEAQRMTDVQNQVRSKAEEIRGQHWLGLGAERFYVLYDERIMPGFDHLIRYWENAADDMQQIADRIDESIDRVIARARSAANI